MSADLDNGYTRIANELLEGLAMLDLSGREFRIVATVIRKTYGFRKKADWIALDQITEATGIAKENVSRLVSTLVSKKILLKEGGGYTKKLSINTLISDWFHVEQIVENDNGDVPKQQNVESDKLSNLTANIVESDNAIVENDNGDVGFRQPQKKKETITKEKKESIYGKHDFEGWPEKPSEQVFIDWLTLRKSKRAPVTSTVMRDMGSELTKALSAGYSVDFCLTQQLAAGWQGFRLDWMLSRIRGSPASKSAARHNEFENRDYTAGVRNGTF